MQFYFVRNFCLISNDSEKKKIVYKNRIIEAAGIREHLSIAALYGMNMIGGLAFGGDGAMLVCHMLLTCDAPDACGHHY